MAISGSLTRNNTLPDSAAKTDFYQLIDGTTVTLSGTAGSSQLDLSAVTQNIVMSGKAINESQGSNIASATTPDIGAATGNYVVITGTTTITGFATAQAGTRRHVEFSGALTLTHNATSLILPGAANITTVAGDCATFISEGSGNWRCTQYQRASGTALSSSAPTNYRSGMVAMQASTTTLTVAPGFLEVNGSIISKTANTTLTVSTAGDYAGGSSLRATSTTFYIGVDASGNIKIHTTAPTHGDYALSVSSANITKRYASWSSTTYRIIAAFRTNATGSGEVDVYGVFNLPEMGIKNVVRRTYTANASGTTTIPGDNTIPQNTEGDQYMTLDGVFFNVNSRVNVRLKAVSGSGTGYVIYGALFQDSTANAIASAGAYGTAATGIQDVVIDHEMKAGTTSKTTFNYRGGTRTADGGTYKFNESSTIGAMFNGTCNSFIEIEEFESQLT